MKCDQFRRSLAVIVGAVVAAATASPAHGEPGDEPYLSVSMEYDIVIGAEGAPGKAFPLWVEGRAAVHPTLTIDFSDVAGFATVAAADEACQLAGTTITCDLPDSPTFTRIIPLRFRPAAGAAAGESGTVRYAVSADNVAAIENSATLTVRHGVDLVTILDEELPTMKPGDRLRAPVEFQNLGNQAAASVELMAFFSPGVIPDRYANCEYTDPSPESPFTVATCRLRGPFAPDADTVYRLAGFGTTIAPDALDDETVDLWLSPVESPYPAGALPTSEGGSELVVTAVPATVAASEIDDRDNWAGLYVEVDNEFDLAAIGARVSGRVGDVVTARVGVRNAGAGSLDSSRIGDPVAWFTVVVPAGTEAVRVPEVCQAVDEDGGVDPEPGAPGAARYACRNPGYYFRTGDRYQVEFGLRITAPRWTPGAVVLDDYLYPPYDDDNRRNDAAPIIVTR